MACAIKVQLERPGHVRAREPVRRTLDSHFSGSTEQGLESPWYRSLNAENNPDQNVKSGNYLAKCLAYADITVLKTPSAELFGGECRQYFDSSRFLFHLSISTSPTFRDTVVNEHF